ncbi:DUF1629 domain-containing protein [uncultured Legionella sp.]|uniref:imm11 family protein n=1 Tax=uncultured Legionella sp. TaxID=210934 RepID=UPI0026022DFA|nr:DUF1629 domain-containing protein [uncultured Legionella sp.]
MKTKNCTNKMIAEYNRNRSPDRFLFLNGAEVAFNEIKSKCVFEHEMTKIEVISKFDAIPNNCASPLVNQKIIDLLIKLAPDEVQFFDTEVHCKDGVINDYKLLNVTKTFVGIDHEKSICEFMGGNAPNTILGFKYLTYKPNCMGSLQIARDKEYISNLLVSEKIKQEFERKKIKGIWFSTPEEWYSLV